MSYLSLEEKIEIILIYGESARNLDNAVTLYAERFPDKPRSRATIHRVVNQFTTEGSVKPKKRTCRATVTGENNQIAVLAAINYNPRVSIREISHQLGISHTSVWKILKRHNYHPYHFSMHQELHGDDFNNRMVFCNWALTQLQRDPQFFCRVMFSDETTFTNHGKINRHNMHYWSIENPHCLREVEQQRPWSLNVWCGIIGDKLIGPLFIEGTLNGEKYCNLLQDELPILLEDVPLVVRQNMWFQHDGCPAHYSTIAREVLNHYFNDRWIGRGGPVNWPARSPDLSSLDFF